MVNKDIKAPVVVLYQKELLFYSAVVSMYTICRLLRIYALFSSGSDYFVDLVVSVLAFFKE